MLKNILSLLLSKFYSKKENEAVGHQAMPSGISITLLSNATVNDYWGTVSSGVAAADGYLVLTARNAGNEGASLSLNVGGVARQSLIYPFVGAGGNAFVPIGKGDSWALFGSSSDSITLKLYKTIGGGGYQTLKKLILQGGGLCLNSLSSSLRRSSCRVRERGFNTQSVHQSRRSTSLSLKTMRGTLLRPVRTVTLRSQETPRVSFWKFPQAAQGLLIAKYFRGDTSFLSQKVSHSHTWCHLIQLLTRFSLSQCGLKTNSALGGASC